MATTTAMSSLKKETSKSKSAEAEGQTMDKDSIIQFFSSDEEMRICHFCRNPFTPYHHRLVMIQMSPEDMEELFHCGWVRSAMVLFKPIYEPICCREYNTITSAMEFQLSKSQKKVLRRFLNYLEGEGADAEAEPKAKVKEKAVGKNNNKNKKKNVEDYFTKCIAPTCQRKFHVRTHRLHSPELRALFYDEIEVYEKYLSGVHGLTLGDSAPETFKSQYCTSPLVEDDADFRGGNKDKTCGTFHQLYYIDQTLIAIGVIDVTPTLLTSVAFFYDPFYRFLSIGTIGTLLEIAYVRYLHHSVDSKFEGYSMGIYVPTYTKFSYKVNFEPCYILKATDKPHDWVLLDEGLRKSLENGGEIPKELTSIPEPQPEETSSSSSSQKEYRKIKRMLTFPFVGRIVNATGYHFEVVKNQDNGSNLAVGAGSMSSSSGSVPIDPEDKEDVDLYCSVVGEFMARRLARLLPSTLTNYNC